MTCRVACQPEPPRHWPSFTVPGLPDGWAGCLMCGDWITALDLFDTVCPGSTIEGCPEVSPMAALPDPDGERLTDGGPVGVAPSLADPRDAERERTLAEIQRCAEHQL